MPREYANKVKIFIGKGNNSRLVRSIINRRGWYQLVEKIEDANFAWTQIKNTAFFAKQPDSRNESLKKDFKKVEYINSEVLNNFEAARYNKYKADNVELENKLKYNMKIRNRAFNIKTKKISEALLFKVHNHLCNNFVIGNKKALLQTMKSYYTSIGENVFDYLPLTFHVKNGIDDDEYLSFLKHFFQFSKEKK